MGDKSMGADTPWPVELVVGAARDRLTVRYDGGLVHTLSAEFLRVLTPSAERTGHGRRVVIGGKRAVKIEEVRPVGRYAVRIHFDDGHSTGLYTFAALFGMGETHDALWAQYCGELSALSLTRDHPGQARA